MSAQPDAIANGPSSLRASRSNTPGSLFVATRAFVPNVNQLKGGAIAFSVGHRFRLLDAPLGDDEPWLHMRLLSMTPKKGREEVRGYVPRYHVEVETESGLGRTAARGGSTALSRARQVDAVAERIEALSRTVKRYQAARAETASTLVVGGLARGTQAFAPTVAQLSHNVIIVEPNWYYRVLRVSNDNGWVLVGDIKGHPLGYAPRTYIEPCALDLQAFAAQTKTLLLEAALDQSQTRRAVLAGQLSEWTGAIADSMAIGQTSPNMQDALYERIRAGADTF